MNYIHRLARPLWKKLNDNTHTPIDNIYGMELRERPLLTSMKMVLIEITMEKMVRNCWIKKSEWDVISETKFAETYI